jgi:predicted ATPase
MLEKLHIQNFKCLVDEKLDFNYLNIFAGGNAVGKSSVIQSILLLKKAFEDIEKKEIGLNDVYKMNLGLPKDIISKERISEEILIDVYFSNGKENDVKLIVGNEITSPLSLSILNYDDILTYKNEQNVFSNGFYYLNAERTGPRISLDMNNDKELFVGSQGEYTFHAIQKAYLMQLDINKNLMASSAHNFVAQCEAWLDIIIPGVQLKLDINEGLNKTSIKYKNLNISSDYNVPTTTGFGITYVLPIIVSGLICSAYQDSILIVENPEAHLHPFGQSQIGKFLAMVAACGVQVIIETHSDHVINGARLQLAIDKETEKMCIYFFSHEDKKVNIEKIIITEFGELNKWPTGFFDQNKIDLRKLLELRLCKK